MTVFEEDELQEEGEEEEEGRKEKKKSERRNKELANVRNPIELHGSNLLFDNFENRIKVAKKTNE